MDCLWIASRDKAKVRYVRVLTRVVFEVNNIFQGPVKGKHVGYRF